jgi:hypothetical protein
MPATRVTATLFDSLLRTLPMLATSLQAAWYWGDPSLRVALETSIRSLVGRFPPLLPVLKQTMQHAQPLSDPSLDRVSELAGLLLTLWALGDAVLRAEVETMILGYAGRHAAFAPGLRALAQTALTDPRVVGREGQRAPTAAQLRIFLERLPG